MNIKTESKTVIEINAHYKYGDFTTLPCIAGQWWDEVSSREREQQSESINFHDEIKKIKFLEGEYKVTITLEKINQ